MAHVSIQEGFNLPPLKECKKCCFPSKYHCPFCVPEFFKPAKQINARIHLDNHRKRAVFVGDYTIHKCGLECRPQQHYHCMYCGATLIRRIDFVKHLQVCRPSKDRARISHFQRAKHHRVQSKAQASSSPPPGENDDPSEEMDSGGYELYVVDGGYVVEGGYQSGQGANNSSSSSSMLAMSTEPDSSRCDKTVQTNIERPQDCDEYYFKNLSKMFKKLSPQKKAEVRLKIERLLFEAEFE